MNEEAQNLIMQPTPADEPCKTCGGSREKKCPKCRGEGWYLEKFSDNHRTPCNECGGYGEVPCPDCAPPCGTCESHTTGECVSDIACDMNYSAYVPTAKPPEPAGEFVKEWEKRLRNAKMLFKLGKSPDGWFQSMTIGFFEALDIITSLQARISELNQGIIDRDSVIFRHVRRIDELEGLHLEAKADKVQAENDACVLRGEVERLRRVLDKLARLGNEPELGNSKGNVIAQQALKERP